jgi:hypothetical protein
MGELRQVWHDSTDLGYMLGVITGWMVTCPNHEAALDSVQLAEDKGWVGRRTHYAPAFPEGIEAFEVTDAGIDQMKAWGRDGEAARRMRQWYRDNASKPLVNLTTDQS